VELPVGANFLFDVSVHKQELEFPSEVVEVHDSYILTKPVMSKGKVVGLSGEGIHVGMSYLRQSKPPIVWKGLGCTVVKSKGRILYKVVASSVGFEVNRREAFRLFLGLEAVARVGSNRRAMDVILKDVSTSGFAFVVEHDIENVENMPVRLVFKDMERNYDLTGYIIRKIKADEGKYIYGCRLNAKNQLLGHYINLKQRQLLSVNKKSTPSRDRSGFAAAFRTAEEEPVAGFESDADKKDLEEVDKEERRDIFHKNSRIRR
jgi:hypothetical protein